MSRRIETLKGVASGQFIGGYCTRDRNEHKRIVRLLQAKLVRYQRRGYPFYKSFFQITERGLSVLAQR